MFVSNSYYTTLIIPIFILERLFLTILVTIMYLLLCKLNLYSCFCKFHVGRILALEDIASVKI